jgi:hypothetical protein
MLAMAVLAAACSNQDLAAADAEPSDRGTPAEVAPTQPPEPTPTAAPESSSADDAVADAHHPHDEGTPAARLIADTREHVQRWQDADVAEADGFVSIGDGFTGHEHLVHREWALNGEVLNPERPESLVYRVTGEGRELVSAMYILPPGTTMDDVPDLGDDRAVWHLHDDLCWSADGRIAGMLVGGSCQPGGVHAVTPPMLHVWLVDHPCGPFAGLGDHGESCDASHDH